jgi:hypothetical protein
VSTAVAEKKHGLPPTLLAMRVVVSCNATGLATLETASLDEIGWRILIEKESFNGNSSAR